MVGSINSAQYLSNRLESVKDKQGCIAKAWNGFKEIVGIGTSEKKCDSMLKKYNNGEISFEEALEYIEEFDKKQENMADLIANIATGAVAIAAATATCGGSVVTSSAIAIGSPIGALTKTGLKTLDRATNNIKGDELEGKQIVKDIISGATTGATSAVPSHIFKGVKDASLATTVIKGTTCGLACGASSGAINYLTDTALDENKEFKFGELTKTAALSAAVSGSVGALVGGGVYGIHSALKTTGENFIAPTMNSEIIFRDSMTSSARKVLANGERNLFAA